MSLMAPPPFGGGKKKEQEYEGPPVPEGVPLVGFCCHDPTCNQRHGWVLRSADNPNPCAVCGRSAIVTYPCDRVLEVARS